MEEKQLDGTKKIGSILFSFKGVFFFIFLFYILIDFYNFAIASN